MSCEFTTNGKSGRCRRSAGSHQAVEVHGGCFERHFAYDSAANTRVCGCSTAAGKSGVPDNALHPIAGRTTLRRWRSARCCQGACRWAWARAAPPASASSTRTRASAPTCRSSTRTACRCAAARRDSLWTGSVGHVYIIQRTSHVRTPTVVTVCLWPPHDHGRLDYERPCWHDRDAVRDSRRMVPPIHIATGRGSSWCRVNAAGGKPGG